MTTTTYTSISLGKIDTLDSSTLGIIELAKALLSDKEFLPKAEFNKIVQAFGWGKAVVRSYIKIAQAFADVEISKLARIEPRTLFKITSNKKFASVVKAIRDSVGHVTQQLVEHLISACITPRVSLPDNLTIWRGEKDGSRSCVVPPIKEDDQFTGMCIQRAIDDEGMTAQSFVREAAAFREAWLSGAFLLVGELSPQLQAILGEKLEYSAATPVDDIEVQTDAEQTETDETTVEVVEVVETMEATVEPMEVPQIQLAIPEDIKTSMGGNEDLSLNDSIESMSFEKVAILMMQCTTWYEVLAIASIIDEQTRIKSWKVLTKSEQRRIIIMKEAAEPSIQVGGINGKPLSPLKHVATSGSARN